MGEILNKKFLLRAAVAALALLGVLLLLSMPVRPRASSNEHFGGVDALYTFIENEWTPVALEGDTDAFPSAEVKLSLRTAAQSSPEICDFDTRTYVPFSELRVSARIETTLSEKLMLTSTRYEDGEAVDDGTAYPYGSGCIERRGEDGEWMLLRGLGNGSEVLRVSADTNAATLNCTLPASARGEYRFTYHFRKYFSKGYGDSVTFSTGDELYTVSFVVAIPKPQRLEPSGEKFDLLAFTLDRIASSFSKHSNFEVVLRTNGGEAPHIRSYGTRLQYLDGGRWRDAEPSGTLDEAVMISLVSPKTTTLGPDGESVSCLRVTGAAAAFQSGSYRLILGFTEEERGQGEKYPLTIYFDIPEEATK